MAAKSTKVTEEPNGKVVDVEEVKDAKTAEEQFNEEASKIPVPTSVGMNNFRQQINDIITNASLHPECILEILRSATNMVEHMAADVASAEMSQYREKIQSLQTKYKLN